MASVFGVIQAPVASPQTPPALNNIVVTDRSYETAVTTISGIGSIAYVKVNKTGDSATRRDFVDLTVTNALFTTTASRALVRAYETDVNSNLYLASFGFRSSATAPTCAAAGYGNILGTCSVQVDPTKPTTNVITLAATGLTGGTLTWKPSTTAEMTTIGNAGATTACDETTVECPDINGYLDILTITIDDPELNTTASSAETYPSSSNPVVLRATATNDPTGETITIIETTATSGVFKGSLGFEANNFPNNGLLYVQPSDTVRLVYIETANKEGQSQEHVKEYEFLPSSNGGVFLDAAGYFGTSATAQVVVTDTDQSGDGDAQTVDVTITGSGTCSITVTATEVGGRSGIFIGNFGFTTSGASSGTTLCAQHQDLITASYSDVGVDGITRDRTTTARFYEPTTVSVFDVTATTSFEEKFRIGEGATITPSATQLADYRLTGFSKTNIITLTDQDANLLPTVADTVTVTVKSTSDPAGIPLTLTETGPDTSEFSNNAALGFVTSGTSTSSSLRVASGDFVSVVYEDPHNAAGTKATVASQPAVWKPPTTGSVVLGGSGSAQFFRACTKTLDVGASVCKDGEMDTKAEIIVTDADRNHPFVRDTFSVTAVSGADSDGISIDVKETGTDTGVFRGMLRFTDNPGGSRDTTDELQVLDDGEAFTVRYADTNNAQGTSEQVPMNALWRRGSQTAGDGDPRVLRFEAGVQVETGTSNFYRTKQNVAYVSATEESDTTFTVVYHGDLDNVNDEKKIVVSTDTCPAGEDGNPVKIDLVQDPKTRGRWTDTIILRTLSPTSTAADCPSGSTAVGVRAAGDKVYLSHETLSGITTEPIVVKTIADRSARWVERDLSTTTVRTTGTSSAGRILITDPNRNVNTGAIETTTIRFQSFVGGTDGDITLPMVETGPDTGVFLAGVGFCQGAACDADETKALVRVKDLLIDGPPGPVGAIAGPPARAANGIKDSIKTVYPVASADSDAEARLDWYEGETPTVTVAPLTGGGSEIFGTGQLAVVTVAGEDGAGAGARVYDEMFTTTDQRRKEFTVGAAPFVRGSELVYATYRQEFPAPGATDANQLNTDSPVTLEAVGKAEEAVSDRNLDGAVTCADITIEAFSLTGASAGVTCESVSDGGTVGKIAFSHDCNGDEDSVCGKIRVRHEYRAKLGSDTATSDTNRYEYKRTPAAATAANPTAITFMSNLPSDHRVRLEYAKARKTVSVTSTGATELETISLTYQPTPKTFTGTFTAETTQTGGNGRIKVSPPNSVITAHYHDGSKPWGEAATTSTLDYRNIRGAATWRNTTDAVVSFHSADYATALTSTVAGDFVSVQIANGDSDLSDRRDVISATAKTTRTGSPLTGQDTLSFSLRETEAHSGLFRGVVPTNVGTDSASTLDFNTGGGTLTVDFSDLHAAANGQAQLASAERFWNAAEDATIVLCLVPFGTTPTSTGPCTSSAGTTAATRIKGSEGALYIQVFDPDSNLLSNTRDTINVRVYSDRPNSQKIVSLQETASSTGFFRTLSGILFEADATAGDKIHARDLDTIYVRYDDPAGANGLPKTVCRVSGGLCSETQWDRTFDGEIRFGSEQYLGETSDSQAALLNRGLVILPDGDLNTSPTTVECYATGTTAIGSCTALGADIALGSTASGATEPNLALYETGANSGVFIGNVSLTLSSSASESGATNGKIKVVNEGILTLTYTDPVGATGTTAEEFRHEAKWYVKGRGVPVFNKDLYTRDGETARITLFDFSNATATTPPPASYTVNVQSQTTSTPLAVTVTSQTGTPGIYAGTVTLTSAASGGLRVRGLGQEDLVSLTYSDAEPAGTRSTTARVKIGDFAPPTTTLTITPATPNGENGWYVTNKPRINFTVSEDVDPDIGTQYRIDSAPLQPYQEPFLVDAGVHNITYFSTDESGNVEASKVFAVKVDLTPPAQVVGNLQATAIAGGKIRLNWSLPNPPTDFQRYNVFREGQTARIGNTTTGSFVDTTPEDKAWRYHVEVVDLAGNRGLPSPASAAVTSDRRVPIVTGALAEPSSFDIRDGITSVALSATVSDPSNNLQSVRAEVRLPGSNFTQNITMSGNVTSGGRFTGPFGNFTIPGIYQATMKGIDRVGNEGTQLINISVFGPDSIDPTISVAPPSGSSVAKGVPITITAEDNFGISALRYKIDDGAFFNVAVPAGFPVSLPINVPTAALALGDHTMVIEAVDKPDLGVTRTTTSTVTFTIVPGGDLPTSLFLSNVKVTSKRDGTIEVSWEAPGNTGNKLLAGFIVWRSASPYVPVAYLGGADTTYHDTNTTKGVAYKYAVSWFATDGFGNVSAIDQVTGYPGSDDAIPATSVTSREGLSALQWFLLVGIPLIAIAVAIALALVVRSQRRRPPSSTSGQQVVMARKKPAAEAEERPKPAEQRHVLKCPQCQHRFEVYGTKPIVTNCPNCGRKGILR